MNRQDDRELASQYVINALMDDNDCLLKILEDLEHEDLMMDGRNEGWLKRIEYLLTLIDQDNSRGNKRSVLRKTLLLRGLLKMKLR